jgi:diguanylate cyclase (GGDEF)-like protein
MYRWVSGWRSPGIDTRLPRLTAILGMLTTLCLCSVCAAVLLDLRDGVRRGAEQQSLNLLQLAKLDVARNFEMFDLSIRAALDGLDEPGFRELSPALRRMVLFDRSASASYLGAIKVLDEHGRVVEDSDPTAALPIDLAESDAFRHHRADPSGEVYLGRPSLSPLTGDLVISVSRRRSDANGRFAGIVIGTMRLAYFQSLFQGLSLGGRGAMTLFHTDGTVLVREPFAKDYIGKNILGSPGFKTISATRSGTFTAQSALDGVERFYTFARIGDLPLILSVARSSDDILSDWWTKALVIGLVVVGLGGVTGALTVALQRELWQRESAETRVLAANAELAALAVTDALTGLYNRRRFDEDLTREWRRSLRTGKSLSIVMIDADNFKAFNDTYGHQAGDGALRTIGAALRENVREDADVACRIGGEEFALLMPETDQAGALVLAERVRDAIASRAIPHTGNQSGVVTVSIGVAALVPVQPQGAPDLVAAADAALYEAKATGRNQVKAGRPSEPRKAA